jgi:hypothetical protein
MSAHRHTIDRGSEEGRPAWQHGATWWSWDNAEARVEWNLFPKSGFGVGFRFGRNGSESDVGLDLYAGRLGSVWTRLRSPWTQWARVSQDSGENWHYARHTGVRLFPFDGCLLQINVEDLDGYWRRGRPWWNEITLTVRHLLGLNDTTQEDLDAGTCQIPLPEGVYDATYVTTRYTNWYTGRLGKLRDRILGPRSHVSVSIDIPGGIPVQGKGENSWDCGMDGVFGQSGGGTSVEAAIGSVVGGVLRDRRRYGGPHDLTRPMTVREAEAST